MKYITSAILITAFFLSLMSCEDPIELENGFDGPTLVVDAWVNNNSEKQTITITESQNYFENRLPTPITGASVTVLANGSAYNFIEEGNGQYIWTPFSGQKLGEVGDELTLEVVIGTETYTAKNSINRVPEIDSISIFVEDEAFGAEEGLFAEVYARDLPGKGDTYWVKSSRNDTLLSRPQELNVVYDATFDSGNDIDNIYFIRPLRFAINARDEDGQPRALEIGDKVGVEIHSISNDAFDFLKIVQEQTTNGDNTIFAVPIANAKSNITSQTSGEPILGFFNIAAVSSLEKIVE